jgi:hypothetical protein
MLPSELTADQFSAYPPQAKRLVTAHLNLLKNLPPIFTPLLLREIKAYDWKFPAEQKEVDVQLAYLRSLSGDQLQQSMAGFARIQLPTELTNSDWINAPELFSQRLSASLWATNQIDSFRAASIRYVNQYQATAPPEPLPVRRLTIVVLGEGVQETSYPLFGKLREHGVYYTNVDTDGGLTKLLDAVQARHRAHPIQFAHWYVDGGSGLKVNDAGLTCVSYASLAPLRLAVLNKLRAIGQAVKGPERLQESLTSMQPEQFGLTRRADTATMDHFQLSVFTEGSGTQLYSTTFVQWTAHELLRRAQPLTTFVRFAPRQKQRPMDEMLADEGETFPVDPEGSLVDADMGAYYIWLNQRRLAESNQASFLVWFEDHRQALMISPTLRAGTVSRERTSLDQLLARTGDGGRAIALPLPLK